MTQGNVHMVNVNNEPMVKSNVNVHHVLRSIRNVKRFVAVMESHIRTSLENFSWYKSPEEISSALDHNAISSMMRVRDGPRSTQYMQETAIIATILRVLSMANVDRNKEPMLVFVRRKILVQLFE